jgi:hypothetical protein
MPYRKLILEAIEQLHDYHSRSSVEQIRKHVKASVPPEEWNNTLFLTTLKSVIQDGDLELANAHCELTESFKKQRVEDIIASVRKENPSIVINPPPFIDKEPGSPKRRPSHSQQKLAKQRSMERSK